MRVIFVKEYIDKTSFDNWVIITPGEEGLLLDEYNGNVEMTEGFVRPTVLEGVPAGCYLPVRTDLDPDDN